MLRFRSNWFVTTDLSPAWELRDDGWRIRVDGDAPLDVTIRFPIPSDPLVRAQVMPNVTAHRPVNAVPAVCAARTGIVTSADLPQIIPNLARRR